MGVGRAPRGCQYWDRDLAADLGSGPWGQNQAHTFVFLDAPGVGGEPRNPGPRLLLRGYHRGAGAWSAPRLWHHNLLPKGLRLRRIPVPARRVDGNLPGGSPGGGLSLREPEHTPVDGLVARRSLGGSLDLGALGSVLLPPPQKKGRRRLCTFQEMYAKYTQRHTARGDRPCFFARLGPDQAYNTEEADVTPASIPQGCILARDVLGLS